MILGTVPVHTQHAATSVNDTKRASRDFDGALAHAVARLG